jgi:tRNA-2-methylthio-N6-dimethylallyladenosine synthase
MRIRFSTSNPRDMTEAVLYVMTRYDNICKSIHLPVQSGNDRILDKMNRGYTRQQYMNIIRSVRTIMPEAGISSDIISGFCSETEEEHQETLTLMEEAGFDFSYMYKYSDRPGTMASKKYPDDIPEEIKLRRLNEVIVMQTKLSHESNKKDLGKTFLVLADSISKRSDQHLSGRNSQNKVVIFPKGIYKPGDYVHVKVTGCTPATLLGEVE